MSTFAYRGNETVGKYVMRQLEGEWQLVEDVAKADFVITYCTHSSAIEDAYFDQDGIVKNARKGTVLVDLSASTPSLAREIAAVATVSDLKAVEAPLAVLDVTLDDAFSARENFVCYAAGEKADFEEAEHLLGHLAGLVKYIGASGSGQLTKAAHTMQFAAQFMAVIEADALRRAIGSAYSSLDSVTGTVEPLSDIAALALEAVDSERFTGTFTIEMVMGDIVAAMTTADDVELILPQLEATMHLLEVLAVIGGADMAPAALSLVYRDEEASAKAGLDWTRAENLFADGHDHEHGHDHRHFDDDFDDYDDGYDRGFYDDYDDEGGLGFGFGSFGYSAN